VKEFHMHHQKYLVEWYKYEQNTIMIFCMHTSRAFRTYLGWYQQATHIKMRQRWTDDGYTDDGSFDDEDTIYNACTREGSIIEQVPF
jgi:hypothetical protein